MCVGNYEHHYVQYSSTRTSTRRLLGQVAGSNSCSLLFGQPCCDSCEWTAGAGVHPKIQRQPRQTQQRQLLPACQCRRNGNIYTKPYYLPFNWFYRAGCCSCKRDNRRVLPVEYRYSSSIDTFFVVINFIVYRLEVFSFINKTSMGVTRRSLLSSHEYTCTLSFTIYSTKVFRLT